MVINFVHKLLSSGLGTLGFKPLNGFSCASGLSHFIFIPSSGPCKVSSGSSQPTRVLPVDGQAFQKKLSAIFALRENYIIMPGREAVAYFGAGPAPLPTPVLQKGAEAFVNFEETGLSLAEISHRSQTANKVLADTKTALTSLLQIPDSHDILFMHGGGSGEFSAVVFNMVAVWVEKRRKKAEDELGGDEPKILQRVKSELQHELRLDYLVTGSWSLKASQEAANLLEPLGKGFVNVALDSRESNAGKFGTIPPEDTWSLSSPGSKGGKGSAFVYYCDNETVDGVEFPGLPHCLNQSSQDPDDELLVVADMSSNFLSRRVDVSKYAVIFVSSGHWRNCKWC